MAEFEASFLRPRNMTELRGRPSAAILLPFQQQLTKREPWRETLKMLTPTSAGVAFPASQTPRRTFATASGLTKGLFCPAIVSNTGT
jgi:hypothetical protein